VSDRPPDSRDLDALAGIVDLTPTPENILRWVRAWHGHARGPTPGERRDLLRKIRRVNSRLAARWATAAQLAPERKLTHAESLKELQRLLGDPGLRGRPELRFIEFAFANAGNPKVLELVRRAPEGLRPALYLRRGIKPWRVRASRIGSRRSLEVRRHGKDGKGGKTHRDAEAVRLHVAGLSNREIAERLQVHEKTVQRALAGNRARRRTGRHKRVADICGQSKHARDPALRSVQVETRR